ncbi:hypothetical protein GcC1_025002 [Golovinomyces cichoracearum]|uniref:AAA+ ATPase domain-containing protein n=1 Tax=Golovinomyces cichoracearum TaxID=62708 RepID=A0A420J416_9PEZI|nr:hypothetical protein GcC1_025002 [Golovinomyces cichoracearum]
MDSSSHKKIKEAEDRQGGSGTAEEATGSGIAINSKSNSLKNDSSAKSKKNKVSPNKLKNLVSKKTKDIVSSSSDDSDSSDDSSMTEPSDSSDLSEDEKAEIKGRKRNKRKTKFQARGDAKDKKKAKLKKIRDENSFESESEPDDTCQASGSPEDAGDININTDIQELQKQLLLLQIQAQRQQLQGMTHVPNGWDLSGNKNLSSIDAVQVASLLLDKSKKPKKEKKPKKKRASKLEYKRVDELWDSTIHNYKLSDTAQDVDSSEYDQYLFNVRRTFDWEGKYKSTVVDIKSKFLKEVLSETMDGVKGVSVVEDTPSIDPNMLFLYLEDLRESYKGLKHRKFKDEKTRKKSLKRDEIKRKHLKVLIQYLDKDYATIKRTLYPMLESGLITFDLLWALYKPNTLAFTNTYGSVDEPRVFKIELAEKEYSFLKGEWYDIEGRYLEYDGKIWGMGTMECEVGAFNGSRKITSLNCYPLKYHKNEDKLRADLIERGKKFVSLQGVNYKSHEGMAYYKKRKQIVKVHINGRIMIDPAIHRRILPNYNVSTVKPKDPDILETDSENEENCCSCVESSSEGGQENQFSEEKKDKAGESEPKLRLKVVRDQKDGPRLVQVLVDPDVGEIVMEKLEEVPSKKFDQGDESSSTDGKNEPPVFTDEEYLIASPVVLGFAFAEKLWLEFTVRGIKDIIWNDGAYDSLVLEDNTKSIVKALVESHKYHPAKNIDDVIQGKGKGLVAVLHGPPGTGKTLTAEGISELLKCPLYMVSAGELGTDPRTLEAELQKILDIAHSWGAVLLLDEADVFLEKRNIQDIHRNALVSIFLRLLEYFQGILFLTTNRVETFDDAFQSRIHIALRYGELSNKARFSVFKMFLERAQALGDNETLPFTEEELNVLSRQNLNGRQIKNTIHTAQALAVHNKEVLSMVHIQKVLEMSNSFDRDLKGGPGFEEAMRGYF